MRKLRIKRFHPGEILREESLVPLNLSAGAPAKTGVPRTRIERGCRHRAYPEDLAEAGTVLT